MKSKLAIITSGGGMTCMYSAGAILALVDKYGLKTPDILIAASGSAGMLFYYVTGQYDSIRTKGPNLLSTKKFINLLRFWKIVDVDYVVDVIFKKIAPVDIKKVQTSKIHCLIAATNNDSGETEYFSNKNGDDMFEALRASAATPFGYGRAIRVNGKRYLDTYNSSSVELNSLKAAELGAKKLIVIDNQVPTKSGLLWFDIWLLFQTRKFRRNYAKQLEKRRKFKIPENTEAIFLKPRRKLGSFPLNNRLGSLRQTMKQGYEETIANKDLQAFLK